MAQRNAGIYGNRCERIDLPNDKICNLLCRQLKVATAEVFAIVETGMSTHRNATVASE